MKSLQNLTDIMKILKQNKKTLLEKYGVLDIAVFGSYVRDEQKKRSDIDIFVELKEERKTFDNYMELKFFLEKATAKKVDLLIKESIREELKHKILKEATYV